jgi:hypothetical protein
MRVGPLHITPNRKTMSRMLSWRISNMFVGDLSERKGIRSSFFKENQRLGKDRGSGVPRGVVKERKKKKKKEKKSFLLFFSATHLENEFEVEASYKRLEDRSETLSRACPTTLRQHTLLSTDPVPTALASISPDPERMVQVQSRWSSADVQGAAVVELTVQFSDREPKSH